MVTNISLGILNDWQAQGIGVGPLPPGVPPPPLPGPSAAASDGAEAPVERQPFLLHVHFKETHEPWAFPPAFNYSLDQAWQRAREQLPPNQRALLPPPNQRGRELADPGWAFPEAPSMFAAPGGQAGPAGGIPAGWPLETLGARIVELQGRGDVSVGTERERERRC